LLEGGQAREMLAMSEEVIRMLTSIVKTTQGSMER